MSGAAVTAFAAVTPTEWVAVALAIAYLLLAIRQNPWCWAFAITSASLYLVLFSRAGLVMQAALQVFFVAMAVYGWRQWRGSATREPARVGRWPPRRHALAVGAVAAISGINAWLIADDGAGVVAYADAATAWGSVLATWLVARKLVENWFYWIAIDLVAAALYWSQGLHATAVLYVLYTALAVRGYQAWRRDERVQATSHA
ncbi:MAG TPA: nicotinamide riboside transporter PnuC [Steroidobacteraceae bacterium]|nr:nicotinamide riboside transporter PnuC [Steroidobacteraceae bacterium]